MKVNFFKLNKNKKFNYRTRYLKDESYNNIYELDSVYQKQKRIRSSYDVSSKWSEERLMYRNRSNSSISKTLIFKVLILVFVFLYIIDFDLSIFI